MSQDGLQQWLAAARRRRLAVVTLCVLFRLPDQEALPHLDGLLSPMPGPNSVSAGQLYLKLFELASQPEDDLYTGPVDAQLLKAADAPELLQVPRAQWWRDQAPGDAPVDLLARQTGSLDRHT